LALFVLNPQNHALTRRVEVENPTVKIESHSFLFS
jgi:hypothetical protein